jgi:hypothetical protein
VRAIEQQAREAHGDDYMSVLKSNPTLMSAALSQIVSNDCEQHFGYLNLVKAFCSDHNNILASIGAGDTCQLMDVSGSKMAQWCLEKDEGEDKPRMRTKANICNQQGLKSKFHETAQMYCRGHPEDDWCMCYNVKTGVCSKNEEAAGCKNYVTSIEKNKDFFKDGYEILKSRAHCRPRLCTRPEWAYVPEGAMNDCENSYRFCESDIDIKNSSNSDIIMKCNEGMGPAELPDWWGDIEEGDDWWLKGDREPPFDRFPFNKLPIKKFPKKFDWENKDVRYLTYGSGSSVILCCCCIILIMFMMRS